MIDVRIMKALDFDPKLERVRDPLILSLVAGPAGSLRRGPARGVALLPRSARGPIDALPYDFMLWWLRDWLGVMVTAPLVFAWVYGRSNAVDVAARRRSDRAAARRCSPDRS